MAILLHSETRLMAGSCTINQVSPDQTSLGHVSLGKDQSGLEEDSSSLQCIQGAARSREAALHGEAGSTVHCCTYSRPSL